MILALATGWTPDVLTQLGSRFRAACHWALYVRAIVGEDGIAPVTIPKGAQPEERLAALASIAQQGKLRGILYPEGD